MIYRYQQILGLCFFLSAHFSSALPLLRGSFTRNGFRTQWTSSVFFRTSLFSSPTKAVALSNFRHESQFRQGVIELKKLLTGRLRLAAGGISLKDQVISIIDHPTDILIVAAFYLAYKPLLKALYNVQENLRRRIVQNHEYHHTYEYSIFGYLEKPLRLASLYMPFLYVVDLLSIVLHALGLDAHIKGDLPRLAATCATSIIGGQFVVNIKDWFLHNARLHTTRGRRRDTVRENTVNELSSILIWLLVGTVCIEAMKMNMGFALGSIFALGGVGSASIVLALRSTFENIVGGLLLKLQDKFRCGEVITIPTSSSAPKKGSSSSEEGTVEAIDYVTTVIRREDNSLVNVPNHVFTHGEIINWSRTPYRLLRLQVTLDDLLALPGVISALKDKIASIDGVESKQRSVVVSATGFKDAKNVIIEISCHLAASSEEEAGDLKTQVVRVVSAVLDEEKKKARPAL